MTESVIPAIEIRPATRTDAVEIGRLLTALGHPTDAKDVGARWEQWRASGNVAFVAARTDGTLAGVATLHQMVVLHRARPVGRITALVVDSSSRMQGIGRALVATAEEALRLAGCGLLEITSNERLVDAHAFYEQLGYKRTSIRFAKDLTK